VIPAAPSEPTEARAIDSFPWRAALVRGSSTFAVVALAGLAVPVVMDLFGAGLAASTVLRLGSFYALAFHRVSLTIDVTGTARAGGAQAMLSVGLLTGTAFAGWLLYRSGRALSTGMVDPKRSAAAVGVLGIAYAVPFWMVSLVLSLDLSLGATPFGSDLRATPIVWQALVFPFALAIGCGGAGALVATLEVGGRARTVLVGGWRMFAAAIGLAFVAVLVLAVVRPTGLAAFARAVGAGGPRRAALVLGHHGLLIPNHSIAVLASSMLGCVGLQGHGTWVPVLCPGRLPPLGLLGDPAAIASVASGAHRGFANAVLGRPMPVGYSAFLLVPLVATTYGGRWIAGARSGSHGRFGDAALGGLVFGTLVSVGSWIASIAATLSVSGASSAVVLGPRPIRTGLLALAWGAGGGVLGAALPRRQMPVPDPVPGPDPEPVPPRPTSV
jgi:hypothetical protein